MCVRKHTWTDRQRGTAAAPAPVATALCSAEAVTMASTPWHRGSGGGGVTAGGGERAALLLPLLLWKRPWPPSGHQPPADMSPKLRASLINDALPQSRSLSCLLSFSAACVRKCFVFVAFPVSFLFLCVCLRAHMSPILIATQQIVVNVLS